jgi:predicted DNA binding protein
LSRCHEIFTLSVDLVHDDDWTTGLEEIGASDLSISNIDCHVVSEKYDSETLLVRSKSRTKYLSLIRNIRKCPLVQNVEVKEIISGSYQRYYLISVTAKSDISIIKRFNDYGATLIGSSYAEGLEHWSFLCNRRNLLDFSQCFYALGTVRSLRTSPVTAPLLEAISRMYINLSPRELDSLIVAYRMGYFDFPRRASLEQVSHQLLISKATLNEYIRKGIRKIMIKEMSFFNF